MSREGAVARFAEETLLVAGNDWPGLAQFADEHLEHGLLKVDQKRARFEFGMACIACQAQAIANLFPAEEAAMLAKALRDVLDVPDWDGAGVEAYEAYDGAWTAALQALRRGEPVVAYDKVAVELCKRIGINAEVTILGETCWDPLLMIMLGPAVVGTGPPWWKQFQQQYVIAMP